MKTILLFVLFTIFAGAQEIAEKQHDQTTYLNTIFEETAQGNHTYYRIISNYDSQLPQHHVTYYYKSGNIQSKGKISDKYQLTKQGKFVTYYENGSQKILMNYKDGQAIGPFYTWYPNGKLRSEGENLKRNEEDIKFFQPVKIAQYWTVDGTSKITNGNGYYEEIDGNLSSYGKVSAGVKDSIWTGKNFEAKSTFTEIYDNGKFISGVSTDQNGINHPYKELFINPKSKKGPVDFQKHIAENIRTEDVFGQIILNFQIETDGSVKEVKVLKSLDKMHDQEAIRIVRNYKHWRCAEFRGIKMRAGYVLPITIM